MTTIWALPFVIIKRLHRDASGGRGGPERPGTHQHAKVCHGLGGISQLRPMAHRPCHCLTTPWSIYLSVSLFHPARGPYSHDCLEGSFFKSHNLDKRPSQQSWGQQHLLVFSPPERKTPVKPAFWKALSLRLLQTLSLSLSKCQLCYNFQ